MTDAATLELRDVEAGYGPFRALFGVSLTVPAGGAVALLGSNGAGKTTVARVASGLIRPSAGTVVFDGKDVTGSNEWQLARLGVAHVVEGRSVHASLSVRENVHLSLRGRVPKSELRSSVEEVLGSFPILASRRAQAAGTMSGGEQRLLSLAWALVAPPKLLICDELSLGLAPVVIDTVYEALRTIRDGGTSLLIVEQEVRHALALADHVVVLKHGETTFIGPPNELDLTALGFSSAGTGRSSQPGGSPSAGAKEKNA